MGIENTHDRTIQLETALLVYICEDDRWINATFNTNEIIRMVTGSLIAEVSLHYFTMRRVSEIVVHLQFLQLSS